MNAGEKLKEAVSEVCQFNDRTRGKEAGEVYMSSDILIVTLREPKIVEGEWEDVINLADWMDEWASGKRW